MNNTADAKARIFCARHMVCLATIFMFSEVMADEISSAESAVTHNNQQENRLVSIYFENDIFSRYLGQGQSDKWYTNGVKAVYSYNAVDHEALTEKILNALGNLAPNSLSGDGLRQGVVFGQLMFTPQDISISTPQPSDRFYGGWLYFGGIIQNNNNNQTRTAELDIGLVGPYSLAEQTQKLVHSTFGYTIPAGWNYQIKNEPGVQFSYNNIVRFKSASYADASYYIGGVAGTVFDNVKGGFMLRIGENLEDVPVSIIESPVLGTKPKDKGFYLLIRGETQYVLHNTFIDGSLFRSSPFQTDVKSRPVVEQLTIGIIKQGILGKPVKFSFLANRRTAEFTSPSFGKGVRFTYGSVNLEWSL